MTFDLTGHLLIATPAMGDPRFERSVIYLCVHGEEGAFGLVVNRPLPGLDIGAVLEQLGIAGADADAPFSRAPVRSGGPVDTARGFVLHRGTGTEAGVQALPGGLALSASTETLVDIAGGAGPQEWFLALGYAGWGPGQLEAEIAANAWITAPMQPALLFAEATGEGQWLDALASLGIDPMVLSPTAGHA